MDSAKLERYWPHMTVATLREALSETRTVLIPVGITEQHGYHLPLDTDTIVALEICRRAARETGAVVAPEMRYSYSGGELEGTINIRPAVVTLLIEETLRELARHGFLNLVIVLGHGGTENTAAVEEAADIFQRTSPHLRQVAVAVYKYFFASETTRRAFAEGDFHGGWFETSLLLAICPELVCNERMQTDEPALVQRLRADPDAYQTRERLIEHEAVIPRVHQDTAIRVGVMGEPHRASNELGERILTEAVAGLVALIRQLEAARR
ncbi:MAG: creatininase family protein [Armatimonadetes bacterium]|nr:creatininase family protein [Armatimonadota bacterium]